MSQCRLSSFQNTVSYGLQLELGEKEASIYFHLWKFNEQLLNDDMFHKEVDGCLSFSIKGRLPLFERWERF